MSNVNPNLLDRVEQDLRSNAVGKENATTSAELAERHAPDDGTAQPKTRRAIKVLMRERGLPIIGGSSGYYIPEDPERVSDAVETLQTRIDGIEERRRLLEENWTAWEAGEETSQQKTLSKVSQDD
jgi:hypothetical protein